jgi:hypothetical protein
LDRYHNVLCHVIYTFICNLVVFLCHDLLTV